MYLAMHLSHLIKTHATILTISWKYWCFEFPVFSWKSRMKQLLCAGVLLVNYYIHINTKLHQYSINQIVLAYVPVIDKYTPTHTPAWLSWHQLCVLWCGACSWYQGCWWIPRTNETFPVLINRSCHWHSCPLSHSLGSARLRGCKISRAALHITCVFKKNTNPDTHIYSCTGWTHTYVDE